MSGSARRRRDRDARSRLDSHPRSRRDWGWHPLSDQWARRIVRAANVQSTDLVLDVGAGQGAVTKHLLKTGARVIALELHQSRARRLEERFGHLDRLSVVRADASDLLLPRRAFRVVASPPYSISTALLKRLVARGSRLVRADLVVQRQVAVKWARGEVSGANRWWHEYAVTVTRNVPRHAFYPPPKVDSAVLTIRRRSNSAG